MPSTASSVGCAWLSKSGAQLQNNTADRKCQPSVSQFSGEDVIMSVMARNIVATLLCQGDQ